MKLNFTPSPTKNYVRPHRLGNNELYIVDIKLFLRNYSCCVQAFKHIHFWVKR